MKRPRLRSQQCGLTLIEVVVALAVFSILGILTYRGTAQLLITQQHIETELVRWQAIDRTFQIVENDLIHIVSPRTEYGIARAPALQASQGPGSSELIFSRLSHSYGIERIRFEHTDNFFNWSRRTDPNQTPNDHDSERLLDGVIAARWRFFIGNQWLENFPVNLESDTALPAAIELQIDLIGVGTLTRIYALR